MIEDDKSYDEVNKYDFYKKYYMRYSIGTILENCIEITEKEYDSLVEYLEKNKMKSVKAFISYIIGFHNEDGDYVLKTVDENIYECLFNAQRYERNKIRHERERYLDLIFKQEEINNIASDDNVEEEALKRKTENEIRMFLETNLTQKQSNRFFKNRIQKIPLIIIAYQDGTTIGAIEDSIKRATDKIFKKFEKNKKFF